MQFDGLGALGGGLGLPLLVTVARRDAGGGGLFLVRPRLLLSAIADGLGLPGGRHAVVGSFLRRVGGLDDLGSGRLRLNLPLGRIAVSVRMLETVTVCRSIGYVERWAHQCELAGLSPTLASS